MTFLKYSFIFCLFAIVGWIIELIYRSNITKKLVNPGFMTGCVVPLYGFGAIIINILCVCFSDINLKYRVLFIFIISIIFLSFLEFVSGWIVFKLFNLSLWDYSNHKFNYKGFVCLYFSVIWGIFSVLYYYLVFPWINEFAVSFVNNQFCLLSLGIFYGVFFIDLFVFFIIF